MVNVWGSIWGGGREREMSPRGTERRIWGGPRRGGQWSEVGWSGAARMVLSPAPAPCLPPPHCPPLPPPPQRHDPRTNTSSGCGEGVTAHVRTFLHGNGRITLSIATLPHGEALPGEEKQQVCGGGGGGHASTGEALPCVCV